MKDKKTSHRQTLKKKYAVKEHKRKIRKAAKTVLKKGKSRKDQGIPNSWPFKAEMLKELQAKRERLALEREQKKQQMKALAKAGKESQILMVDENNPDGDNNPYATLATAAATSAARFDELKDDGIEMGENLVQGNSTSSFLRDLRNVVEKADVLVEVLDARDPMGCRNLKLERQIQVEGKKLILLLNKIDLVPRDVVEKWLKYLRTSHPTELFKAATVDASRPMTLSKGSAGKATLGKMQAGSSVLGAGPLLELIKNYSRSGSSSESKAMITVGIVGLPNVGKSSVINSLCRSSNAAKAGGEPGVTRCLKEIALDSRVRLIDSPGVITDLSESDSEAVLRNTVKISKVTDLISVVEVLLQKHSASDMMKLFKVPFYDTPSEFLGHIARARGKICKGGGLDLSAAARAVITDWTSGKIQHFCLPPDDEILDKEAMKAGLISVRIAHALIGSIQASRVVAQFAEAFDLAIE